MLTQDEELILQCYVALCLNVELKNNSFIKSKYFRNLPFAETWVKHALITTDVDSQGALLLALYSILVVPRQKIGKLFKSDFADINRWIDAVAFETKSTYPVKPEGIDYLRHIRNSVAHARVEFEPNRFVMFNDQDDEDKPKRTFSTKLSLRPPGHVGELLSKLQQVHMKFRENLLR